MASSNSFNALVLDALTGNASFGTWPLYISLHNGNPGATGANELSNGTYERVLAGAFQDISTATSVTTNTSHVTFAEGGNGETVTYGGAWHGSGSTGTFLFGGALTSSFAYNAGVTPVFTPGSLRLRGA